MSSDNEAAIDEIPTGEKSTETFHRVVEKVKYIFVGNGQSTAVLKLDKTHVTPAGLLHGGFSATLVDSVSSVALWSQTGKYGVSVNLHISYLKGAKISDEIIISARVLRRGKNLAFLEAEIKNNANGEVLVKALHTKFVVGANRSKL